MLSALINAWKIPELKKRLLFTMGLVLVFRIGAHIPVPGVDIRALSSIKMEGLMGFIDMFSGGALRNFSVFALGIMPYINSSIIFSLLVKVVPYLEQLNKEGEQGRKKINQYTRYGTILLSVVQGIGLSFYMRNVSGTTGAVVPFPSMGFHLIAVVTLTAGTAFIMWLGERITEKGIGNGISLLIFIGIVARFPEALTNTFKKVFWIQDLNFILVLLIGIFMFFTIAGVVLVTTGQRKIPVQHAKRVVGRKIYGASSTYLPLRVNAAGVIPIIFAQSIIMFPATIATYLGGKVGILKLVSVWLSPGAWLHDSLYAVLIIFFTYFYTAITFDPNDTADYLRKSGGFIPGYRAGKSTADYIEWILSRITLPGAVFLALIAILPGWLQMGAHMPFYFGGTSLLIVVGVDLDTMKQIESHMVMRYYDGFIKKSGLRGRF